MELGSLEDLRAFLLVFQERNFTVAASRMGITKAAVAKRVAGLEERWQTQLFYRSTRKVVPTREAERIYQKVLPVIDSARDLEASIAKKEDLEGNLRITCASSMANRFVSPIVIRFQEKYPKINVQLVVTDSLLDLMEESIDIGIRVGTEPPSSLHGVSLFPNQIIASISSEYSKQETFAINRPEDLENHNLLYLDLHKNLKFKGTNISLQSVTKKRNFVSNDSGSLIQAALQGKGVLIRSFWDIQEELKKGNLIPVLRDYSIENFGDVWMVSPEVRLPSGRVSAFWKFFETESKTIFNL
ncbi:LysR family transcriptional regulator [Leptospira idonii]|uniref:LysR family transcriptional regulator n=1 Tax=Leptospira idonii TaxID=1193500 RepID=A0A4R9LW22_9LEPT|nr:LysR family transcriptional regulator [Leptospira idonii]TGN18410.1 LysR family transcriptional regulator [Leptospira idonii]